MQVFSNIQGSHERGRIRRYKSFPPLDIVWYWRTERMDERQQFAVLDPDGYFLRFAQVGHGGRHRPIERGKEINRDYYVAAGSRTLLWRMSVMSPSLSTIRSSTSFCSLEKSSRSPTW